MVKNFPGGGVQKNQKFPKFKNFPNKGEGGGLRTWEQFPSYTLLIITMASLTYPCFVRFFLYQNSSRHILQQTGTKLLYARLVMCTVQLFSTLTFNHISKGSDPDLIFPYGRMDIVRRRFRIWQVILLIWNRFKDEVIQMCNLV